MVHVWARLLENVVFLMFVLPLVGAALVLASARWGAETVRRTALTNAGLTFLLSVLMVVQFDPGATTASGEPRRYQMATTLRWVAEERFVPGPQDHLSESASARLETETVGPPIQLALGVDGISLWFLTLTALLAIPAVMSGPGGGSEAPRAVLSEATIRSSAGHSAAFYALVLLLESALIGAFGAIDVVFFAVCLFGVLLPMFLLLGRWGGFERRRVVQKFVLFQFTGCLLILAGLISLVLVVSSLSETVSDSPAATTFAISTLTERLSAVASSADPAVLQYWHGFSPWIFLCLLLGFVFRAPVFPFHTWLPAANAEAPTALSLLLTGTSLSVGGYGMVRFLLPLFPGYCLGAAGVVTWLGLLGAIYSGLLALAQDDMKKLFAWASLTQLNLCVAGLFSLNAVGVTGGLLQLIAHGLGFGTLWFLIGLRERLDHTRKVETVGALGRRSPKWGGGFLVAVLAVIGVPGLSGFAGQTVLLIGVLEGAPGSGGNALGLFAGLLGLLFVAGAFIMRPGSRAESPGAAIGRSDERVGGSASERSMLYARLSPRQDASPSEATVLAVLLGVMAGIGLWPQFFVSRMQPATSRALSRYTRVVSPVDEDRGSRLENRDLQRAILDTQSPNPDSSSGTERAL